MNVKKKVSNYNFTNKLRLKNKGYLVFPITEVEQIISFKIVGTYIKEIKALTEYIFRLYKS